MVIQVQGKRTALPSKHVLICTDSKNNNQISDISKVNTSHDKIQESLNLAPHALIKFAIFLNLTTILPSNSHQTVVSIIILIDLLFQEKKVTKGGVLIFSSTQRHIPD